MPLRKIVRHVEDRFRPAPVRDIIKEVMRTKLEKAQYHPEQITVLTKQVADEIKDRLKGNNVLLSSIATTVQSDLSLPRYKIIVQVVIGEQRGQGIR